MDNRLFAVFLITGLLLFGCTQAPAQATPAPVSTGTASSASGGVQEFSLTAKQFEFSPATVTVKKGVPVKLTIDAVDVEHGFAIPEFGVQKSLSVGQKNIVEFTPDKAGEFTFFCSVFCGSGHGSMKGKLVVTE